MKTIAIALVVAAFVSPALAGGPAQGRIDQARAAVAARPDQPAAHVGLAMAYSERARETADTTFYDKAHLALDAALARAPQDFAALRARTWVWLGQHAFERALAQARELNRRHPDDLTTYGLLVDANMELGNYAAAERAAQWMLDLRPGNVPGLTRAAYVRETIGDIEGAIELMGQAFDRTPPAETEHRAWLLAQLAHLELAAGRAGRAAPLAAQALEVLPGYHYALHQSARIAQARGRDDEALEWARRHYRAAPHPENLYLLALALERTGRRAEAKAAFGEFERQALAEAQGEDNANRELVRYYADQVGDAAAALRIAKREVARRQDVATLDAYAWALHRSGAHEAAREVIERALAVGTRDAGVLYDAGFILDAAGDAVAARGYLAQAVALAPWQAAAADARRRL